MPKSKRSTPASEGAVIGILLGLVIWGVKEVARRWR